MALYGQEHPGARLGVIAPTFTDARDTCVEGDSGLLACIPPGDIAKWNRSIGELLLRNGTRYRLFSAEEPDRLRGPQHHRIWCDELAAWKYPQDTWDMAMYGLRLGAKARAIVTTTPKPIPLVRTLVLDSASYVTRGSTTENLPNLSASYQNIIARYQGTRLGRQELEAEILDEVPGALWQRAQIDALRVKQAPALTRIVVAVDPAVTSGEDADECGIVIAAKGIDGHGYILEDATCQLSPDGWARRVVGRFHAHKADRIIAETNNGGELVERVIRTVDARVPYRAVHASRGKVKRAEPIAALYEQGRVHHVGSFPALEDEMCLFTPDGEFQKSPNRADALVWALTELFERGESRVVKFNA